MDKILVLLQFPREKRAPETVQLAALPNVGEEFHYEGERHVVESRKFSVANDQDWYALSLTRVTIEIGP